MDNKQFYKTHCKPKLTELLEALKLDKNYESASGSYVYSDKGTKVLDLIGGFGSTIIGHNHPEIIKTSINALKNNIAINAQGSLRNDSANLSRQLSELTGDADSYYVNFSNSGAESIEAAIKHSYKVHFDKVRREYERLTRILNDFYYKAENQQENIKLPGKNKDLIDFRDDLDEYNLAQFEAFQNNPVLVAFKGSFHGKTMSALKVTFNKSYREAFEGLSAIKPVFVDPKDPERIPEIVESNKSTFYYPIMNGDTVELRPYSITRVIGLMFEIVLGEGGIRPLSDDCLLQLSNMHEKLKVPYIIDEIQTGCGRLGNIYAYKDTPLKNIQPEYITLSKALGGGIAKIGATLIKKTIYDQDFGILHTSTFAEDSFSAKISSKFLDILTREDGKLLKEVKQKGDFIKQKLNILKAKYPNIIKDVRGKGLMLGVEFTDLKDRSPFFRASGKQGVLSLLIASYLLEHHDIRLLAPLTTMLKGNPGKKRQSILRIQPPVTVKTEEIDRLINAIDEVLTIIEHNNEYCLVAHLLKEDITNQERENPKTFKIQWPVSEEQRHVDARVGFIVHPTTLENLVEYYFPSFDAYSWQEKNMLQWWNRISRFLEPVHVKSSYVASNDFVLENNMVFVPYLPQYINTAKEPFLVREMQDKVQDAVTVAKELGDDNIPVSIVGLGAFTSIITQNAQTINDYEIPVTTGNAYTTGLALQGIISAAEKQEIELDKANVAVVGASGNIGMVLAQILSLNVNQLCLVGSDKKSTAVRLKYAKEQCYREILNAAHAEFQSQVDLEESALTGIGGRVYQSLIDNMDNWKSPFFDLYNLLEDKILPENIGKQFIQALENDKEASAKLNISTQSGFDDLKAFDIVVVATNSHNAELIKPHMVKPGAVVCCASVPSNLSHDFQTTHSNIAFDGGLAQLPEDSRVDFVGMPGGQLSYGCMAETFLLGFDGQNHSFCKGNLSSDQVYRTLELAEIHGFDLGKLKIENQKLTDNNHHQRVA